VNPIWSYQLNKAAEMRPESQFISLATFCPDKSLPDT
jgi:hypothetical protein